MDRYDVQARVLGDAHASLRSASVAIVGAGGLGCPVALYLAAAGVRRIRLLDGDAVESSNLHRQVLYGPGDVGAPKVEAAASQLASLNPDVTIEIREAWVDASNVAELTHGCDVLIDATDDASTRYALDDEAARSRRPLVHGGIEGWDGQCALLLPGGPRYRDAFPTPAPGPSCAEVGMVGPVAGLVGSMMATLAIHAACGITDAAGALHMLSGRSGEWTRVPLGALVGRGREGSTTMERPWTQSEGLHLIDVRDADERDARPGPGEHIPLADVAKRIATLQGPLGFYCQTGQRSLRAARLARDRGLEAYSMQGGIRARPDFEAVASRAVDAKD